MIDVFIFRTIACPEKFDEGKLIRDQFEWFFVKCSETEWNNTETSVVSRTCPEIFDEGKLIRDQFEWLNTKPKKGLVLKRLENFNI